jgi:endo-1,4-beta-xylanase
MKGKISNIVSIFLIAAIALLLSFWSCSFESVFKNKDSINSDALSRAVNKSAMFLGNIFNDDSVPMDFAKYWNQVTPENGGKWGEVEQSRDQYSWSWQDGAYNYAKSNGIPFKAHCLVWGSQEPNWIGGLSASEQRAEVEEWIMDFGSRYNCDYIDVVNEPLHAKPSYKDAIGGDGSTGWDWVIWAFETAKQYCSGKLLINDYGILNNSSATDNYIQIINLLHDRGLIDGIGVQGHGLEGTSSSTIRSNLDKLAATGLPVFVSEYEVERSDDSQQLTIYQEQFPIFWEHSGVQGVTLWGYIEGNIWKSDAYLLHSNGTERPALTWLMEYVGGVTPTPTPTPTPTVTPTPTPTPTPTSTPTPGTPCDNPTAISIPFTQNGAGEFCWSFSSTPEYINSWNLETLTVNGVDYTNTWVSGNNLPSKINGLYYVYYRGNYRWSHAEIIGTVTPTPTPTVTPPPTPTPTITPTPTPTPTGTPTPTPGTPCDNPTAISIPFTQNGAGEFCWSFSSTPSFINSWNLAELSVNGVDFTNVWVSGSNLPAKINGLYYVYCRGNYAWSHAEIR